MCWSNSLCFLSLKGINIFKAPFYLFWSKWKKKAGKKLEFWFLNAKKTFHPVDWEWMLQIEWKTWLVKKFARKLTGYLFPGLAFTFWQILLNFLCPFLLEKFYYGNTGVERSLYETCSEFLILRTFWEQRVPPKGAITVNATALGQKSVISLTA